MRQRSGYQLGSSSGQANVRSFVLGLAFFVLGFAVSAWWFHHAAKGGEAAGQPPGGLSESTLGVLERLSAPVEIRFYSLLDPASTTESLAAFATRVDLLLSKYERDGQGKIKVSRYNSRSNATANAAAADGMRAFNIDKGEACYLGLAVACQDQKEPLAQLSPDWEPALEPDVTRIILRLVEATSPPMAKVTAPPPDAAVVEEVKAALPNLASLSVEEGSRVLREAALKDFKTAATEMESKVKEAQQRFTDAQNAPSDAERQAALKHLQQVQAQQTEKLQQVAARLQGQIAALKQLKAQGQ